MPDTINMPAAFDVFRDSVAEEFGESGELMIDEMREMLSVDVERENGIVTVRSVKGEPPRRETGALWESISKAVEVGLYGVEATIFTDRPYSAALESVAYRTGQRPHWSTLYQNWKDLLPERVAQRLAQL